MEDSIISIVEKSILNSGESVDKRNGDGFGTFRTYLRICIKWDQNIAKIYNFTLFTVIESYIYKVYLILSAYFIFIIFISKFESFTNVKSRDK